MRRIVILPALIGAALLVVACGGSSTPKATPTPQTPPTPVDETAFAKSMLLTVNDFPSGWTESPSSATSDDDPLTKQCDPKASTQTGKAQSGDFAESEGAPSISESVLVFTTASAAMAELDKNPDVVKCAVAAFNDGKLDSNGITFSDAASKSMSFDAPGDKSYAYQIDVTGTTSQGQATVHIIAAYAVVGRVGYTLTAQSTDQPYSATDLETYAKKAADKLKQKP